MPIRGCCLIAGGPGYGREITRREKEPKTDRIRGKPAVPDESRAKPADEPSPAPRRAVAYSRQPSNPRDRDVGQTGRWCVPVEACQHGARRSPATGSTRSGLALQTGPIGPQHLNFSGDGPQPGTPSMWTGLRQERPAGAPESAKESPGDLPPRWTAGFRPGRQNLRFPRGEEIPPRRHPGSPIGTERGPRRPHATCPRADHRPPTKRG